MVDGFHHAGVAVSDIPQAVAFYSEVVGFDPLGPDDPEHSIETAAYFWMAVTEDEWLNLAARPDATPDHPGELDDPHLAFAAPEAEIDAVKQRVRDRDVAVHESDTSIYFHDPDGNFLELTHWTGPEH